jgi:hypothetical protein
MRRAGPFSRLRARFYLTRGRAAVRLPMTDTLRLWPDLRGVGGRQDLRWFGFRFLRLNYRLVPREVPVAGVAVRAAPASLALLLGGQSR